MASFWPSRARGRIATLSLLAVLLASCSVFDLTPGVSRDVSRLQSVVVALPTETEMDQLTTISRLPASTCQSSAEGKVCSIPPAQALKWGWGFCEGDAAARRRQLSRLQVALVVDGVRIPDTLVYQRDETYDREVNAFCHTWTIKLTGWKSGSMVRLENRARAGLGSQHNVFVLNVQ